MFCSSLYEMLIVEFTCGIPGAGAVSDLGLRLMASAITAIFSLSLLFFLIYRLRQRRLRGRQNHLEAEGYGLPQRVRAVALRARPHVRLRRDADPSQRYMRMLVDGAKELGLASEYVAKLEAITTQRATGVLRMLAVQHLFFATLLFRPRLRWAGRAISAMLWVAYVPSSHPTALRRYAGNACLSLLLLPTAFLGTLVRIGMWATGKEIPPMMKAVMQPPKVEPEAPPSA